MEQVLIHWNEIGLKGKNLSFFEGKLRDRIRGCDPTVRIVRLPSTLLLRSSLTKDALRQKLQRVFGIASFSFVEEIRFRDIDHLVQEVTNRALPLLAGAANFCVRAKRSDKSFPVTSQEINERVGRAVQDALGIAVRLSNPDVTLIVEVLEGRAFFVVERCQGPGGLPTGSAGRLTVLLSGGIDSPVASWKMMSRGAIADLVHFHSYPQTNRASLEKAKDLARLLGAWQGPTTLFLVPLLPVQKQLLLTVDKRALVLLYRRAMMRIAERIARDRGALGLVTGESLGQVASQTLENMAVTSSAATLPIYRPLVGSDKEEIIELARRIKTFDISTRPHEDCCSLFVPAHPLTRATICEIEREEKKVDLDRLCDEAYKQRTITEMQSR